MRVATVEPGLGGPGRRVDLFLVVADREQQLAARVVGEDPLEKRKGVLRSGQIVAVELHAVQQRALAREPVDDPAGRRHAADDDRLVGGRDADRVDKGERRAAHAFLAEVVDEPSVAVKAQDVGVVRRAGALVKAALQQTDTVLDVQPLVAVDGEDAGIGEGVALSAPVGRVALDRGGLENHRLRICDAVVQQEHEVAERGELHDLGGAAVDDVDPAALEVDKIALLERPSVDHEEVDLVLHVAEAQREQLLAGEGRRAHP